MGGSPFSDVLQRGVEFFSCVSVCACACACACGWVYVHVVDELWRTLWDGSGNHSSCAVQMHRPLSVSRVT